MPWMLIIYAVGAVAGMGAGFAAWTGLKEHIAAPYVQAQIKADQKVVDKAGAAQKAAEDERDHAVSDTAACVKASANQSAEVKKWQDAAARMAKAARDAQLQAQREASAAAPKIAELQARAAAAPKLMACEEELGKAKDVLRESLRARRGGATK
ncbi:MAG: hypothetical protein ABI624_19440 [Casimicrobiaceae bacterium]